MDKRTRDELVNQTARKLAGYDDYELRVELLKTHLLNDMSDDDLKIVSADVYAIEP